MPDNSRFQSVPMATFDAATFTGVFVPLNPGGLAEPIKVLSMYNGSDRLVIISLNGVTPHAVLPIGGTLIKDLQTNADKSGIFSGEWLGGQGQVFWGMAAAGTGNIYIMGDF